MTAPEITTRLSMYAPAGGPTAKWFNALAAIQKAELGILIRSAETYEDIPIPISVVSDWIEDNGGEREWWCLLFFQLATVVYVGAPCGDNEFGEIVSRHRSEEAALNALDKLRDDPRYCGTNAVVKKVERKGR